MSVLTTSCQHHASSGLKGARGHPCADTRVYVNCGESPSLYFAHCGISRTVIAFPRPYLKELSQKAHRLYPLRPEGEGGSCEDSKQTVSNGVGIESVIRLRISPIRHIRT